MENVEIELEKCQCPFCGQMPFGGNEFNVEQYRGGENYYECSKCLRHIYVKFDMDVKINVRFQVMKRKPPNFAEIKYACKCRKCTNLQPTFRCIAEENYYGSCCEEKCPLVKKEEENNKQQISLQETIGGYQT